MARRRREVAAGLTASRENKLSGRVKIKLGERERAAQLYEYIQPGKGERGAEIRLETNTVNGRSSVKDATVAIAGSEFQIRRSLLRIRGANAGAIVKKVARKARSKCRSFRFIARIELQVYVLLTVYGSMSSASIVIPAIIQVPNR